MTTTNGYEARALLALQRGRRVQSVAEDHDVPRSMILDIAKRHRMLVGVDDIARTGEQLDAAAGRTTEKKPPSFSGADPIRDLLARGRSAPRSSTRKLTERVDALLGRLQSEVDEDDALEKAREDVRRLKEELRAAELAARESRPRRPAVQRDEAVS